MPTCDDGEGEMDITVSEGPTCGDLVRVTRLRGLVRVSWVSRYDGGEMTWAWGDLDQEQAIALRDALDAAIGGR